MNRYEFKKKVFSVVQSCETLDQLINAISWGVNLSEKYLPNSNDRVFFVKNLTNMKIKKPEELEANRV